MRLRLLVLAVSVVLAGCDQETTFVPRPTPTPSRLTLNASPDYVLRTGSSVQVTATLRSETGAAIAGAPVTFATSSGSVPGTAVTSDAGLVTVTVTADAAGTVTATTDGLSSSLEFRAETPYSLRLDVPTQVFLNEPTLIGATLVRNAAVVQPTDTPRVVVDCGAGPVETTAIGVTCVFPATGPRVIAARAVAANGWTVETSTSVAVSPRPVSPPPPPPPAPTPTPTPTPPPALVASIGCHVTAMTTDASCNVQTLTYGGTAIPSRSITGVDWDWGDGTTSHSGTGASGAPPHTYAQSGVYTVFATVTATTADGSRQAVATTSATVP